MAYYDVNPNHSIRSAVQDLVISYYGLQQIRNQFLNREKWDYWADENSHFKPNARSQNTLSIIVSSSVMNNRFSFQIYEKNLGSALDF